MKLKKYVNIFYYYFIIIMSNSNKKVITSHDWYIVQQLLYVWCESEETQELAMLIRKNSLIDKDRKRIWTLIQLKKLNDFKKLKLLQERLIQQLNEQLQQNQLLQKQIEQRNQLILLIEQDLEKYHLKHQHLLMLILLLLQLLLCCGFWYSIS